MKNPLSKYYLPIFLFNLFNLLTHYCNSMNNLLLEDDINFTFNEIKIPNSFEELKSIVDLEITNISSPYGKEGSILLHKACSIGDFELVKKILRYVKSTTLALKPYIFFRYISRKNQIGTTPLHETAKKGHYKITELLIKKLTIINKDLINCRDKYGRTPLHLAALYGHFKTMKILLKNNAYIDARDALGNTPLHYCIYTRKFLAIKELLEHGAKITAKNQEGSNCLDIARLTNDECIYNMLIYYLNPREFIKNLHNLNQQFGPEKQTVLIWAIMFNHKDQVTYLLSNGANSNLADDDNRTPLMYSAFFGRSAIMKKLILAGANPNSFDKAFNTALMYTIISQNWNCLFYLTSNGAFIHTKAIKMAMDYNYYKIAVFLIILKQRELDIAIEV